MKTKTKIIVISSAVFGLLIISCVFAFIFPSKAIRYSPTMLHIIIALNRYPNVVYHPGDPAYIEMGEISDALDARMRNDSLWKWEIEMWNSVGIGKRNNIGSILSKMCN